MSRFTRVLSIRKRQKMLTNHTFSIISNTCTGGVVTHCVGEQFRSPTVNLVIYENDYIIFCKHLKEYSVCPVELPREDEKDKIPQVNYPVGILRGSKVGLPDINLMFVHYSSFEQAKEKWEERFKRVNYDDLFFIMDRGLDAKNDVLDAFEALPYEHKVFFCDKKSSEKWPHTFNFSFYTDGRYENACIYKKFNRGPYEHYWMDEFDYIHWLNTGEIRRSNIQIREIG